MKPNKQQTWAGVAAIALTIISSYVSVKYERHQVAQESAGNQSVEVHIESVPDGMTHSHAAVVSQNDIVTLIERALKAQHDKDLILFKQKEAWD